MNNIYECKMCGSCCRLIHLGAHVTPGFLKEQSELGNEEAKFILKNWKYLDENEVIRLRTDSEFSELFLTMETGTWWTCTQFDQESKKCRSYDARPDVCKGFPFYGKFPHYFNPYTYDCGYYKDCYPKQEFAGLKADIIIVDDEFAAEERVKIKRT